LAFLATGKIRNWRMGFGISCHRKNSKLENGFWPFLPQEKFEIGEWVLAFLASGIIRNCRMGFWISCLRKNACKLLLLCLLRAPLFSRFPGIPCPGLTVAGCPRCNHLVPCTPFIVRIMEACMGMTFAEEFLDFGTTTLSFSLSERSREISVFFLERRTTSSAATRSCVGEKIGLFVPIRVSFIKEQLVDSELLFWFYTSRLRANDCLLER
jgi:hypothetical protein